MQTFRFPCPHCLVTLRLKDRMFVGKVIDCPDCNSPVHIVATQTGELAAERVTGESPRDQNARHPDSQGSDIRSSSTSARAAARGEGRRRASKRSQPVAKSTIQESASRFDWLQTWSAPLRSPVGVAWTVAGGVTLILVIALLTGESRPRNSARSAAGTTAQGFDSDSASQGGSTGRSENSGVSSNGRKSSGTPGADSAVEESRQRLEHLGQLLSDYVDRNGRFPRGTAPPLDRPAEERFSWLAVLAAENLSNGEQDPLWDQPWNAPLNDRFVRRRLAEFQNPNIDQLVDTHQFPATHFAGVAGVGADAADLPLQHPRAGIFGYNRQTTLDDIRDGTSNTLMVVGVQRDIGAWAAGGRPTIRALTQEPYIHGPDGIGTGQPDRMAVLMADGSVRTVSQQTDPLILRRMAAMADGFPLDPSIPGEPGDPLPQELAHRDPLPSDDPNSASPGDHEADEDRATPNPNGATAERQPPRSADDLPLPEPPLEPPFIAAPVDAPHPSDLKDIAAALGQPILRFEQSRPASVRELLYLVEEMADVPLRIDIEAADDADHRLEKPISLRLQDTTVGEILQAIVAAGDLAFEIGLDHISIQLPSDDDSDSSDVLSPENSEAADLPQDSHSTEQPIEN